MKWFFKIYESLLLVGFFAWVIGFLLRYEPIYIAGTVLISLGLFIASGGFVICTLIDTWKDK